MAQKKVLGRGLGAFFPEYSTPASTPEDTSDVSQTSGATRISQEQSSPNTTVPTGLDEAVRKPGPKAKASPTPVQEMTTPVSVTDTEGQRMNPEEKASRILDVPVQDIRPNPYQPRTEFEPEALQELADSIRLYGLIQPVTVRYIGEKRFELISGERRLRASKLAGLVEIPAYIREADDEQLIALALVENIQREQLNAIEIALGYQRLLDEFQYTQEQVSERVGKKRSTVANMLRLLQLPPFIQAAIRDEHISAGHARALVTIESSEDQEKLLKKIIQESLSVREVERLVRQLSMSSPVTSVKQKTPIPVYIRSFSDRLRQALGTRVHLQAKAKGGEIRIQYASDEELERIMQILDPDE